MSRWRVPAVNTQHLRAWKYMMTGARRPDILFGGAGDMQFYSTNEINLEFWVIIVLQAIEVSKRRMLAVNPQHLRAWKCMMTGARTPDILFSGAGDMQLYPTNEINLEFWVSIVLWAIEVSKWRMSAVNTQHLRAWKYMMTGARRPDILFGGAGDMHFFSTNVINLEFKF